mgnify:CR=1 FL=1
MPGFPIPGEITIFDPDPIEGTHLDDVLNGTNGSENMFGHLGNDTLRGNGSADYLDGGEGADLMIGGTGNDTYRVDNPEDRVIEWRNGGDNDWVRTTTHNTDHYLTHEDILPEDVFQPNYLYTLPQFVENLRLIGEDVIRAIGNDLDNYIMGNEFNNSLYGGGGEDTLFGGKGDDIYTVDSEGDRVYEFVGEGDRDHVISYLDHYRLADNVETASLGGDGNLRITANDLDNFIAGNQGDNTFYASLGNDTIRGARGYDVLKLETDLLSDHIYTLSDHVITGPDTSIRAYGIEEVQITGGDGETRVNASDFLDGKVWLKGEGDNDRLTGSRYNDRIEGGSGHDVLRGGQGNDILFAGSGRDRLYGGQDNDILRGGSGGTDTLTGGSGSDRFELGWSEGAFYDDGRPNTVGTNEYALITDFAQGQDTILLFGAADQYSLGSTTVHGNSGVGIYRLDATASNDYIGNELIGIVQGDTAGLDLNSNSFQFV